MSKPSKKFTREQALDAKPLATTIVSRTPLPDGGERVTVPLQATRMQRWILRVPKTATKQFELDPVGVSVLGMCDGRKSVRYIAQRLAKDQAMDVVQAEHAVIAFLRTMLRKGLIVMVVPRK
ncbi:MAG: PqqD family protein [Planctomycetota bacterium]|nr:PqqD family protein [Planctomycetota bacterium]